MAVNKNPIVRSPSPLFRVRADDPQKRPLYNSFDTGLQPAPGCCNPCYLCRCGTTDILSLPCSQVACSCTPKEIEVSVAMLQRCLQCWLAGIYNDFPLNKYTHSGRFTVYPDLNGIHTLRWMGVPFGSYGCSTISPAQITCPINTTGCIWGKVMTNAVTVELYEVGPTAQGQVCPTPPASYSCPGPPIATFLQSVLFMLGLTGPVRLTPSNINPGLFGYVWTSCISLVGPGSTLCSITQRYPDPYGFLNAYAPFEIFRGRWVANVFSAIALRDGENVTPPCNLIGPMENQLDRCTFAPPSPPPASQCVGSAAGFGGQETFAPCQ